MVKINKELIEQDILYVANLPLPWKKLKNKRILVSGATGMIGSFLIRVLLNCNEELEVIAIARNESKAKVLLGEIWEKDNFHFISHDIKIPLTNAGKIDYMIHAASNTHPVAYASDPIGTITTNVLGSINMLDYAAENGIERFLFASSVEIYGENLGDQEYFDEKYCGYIDCNTLRAGYTESKRVTEAICQAYYAKYGIDFVTARIARTYGPTMQSEDSKAIAQFIKNGINRQDIILKSKGDQLYSYNYVADSVAGLLTVLLKGQCGEAYNVADSGSDITLKELAEIIAEIAGSKVVYEFPDECEAVGYSKVTKALMNADKLKKLGWKANWTMKQGVERTLKALEKV